MAFSWRLCIWKGDNILLKPNKKKIIRILLYTSISICVIYLATFHFVLKGEPFEFAKGFIKKNEVIINTLGVTKKQRLSFFSSLDISGTKGYAEYKIFVEGSKSNGTVYINMHKSAGEWKVLKANLELSDNNIIKLIDSDNKRQ
jgi:hypothetical protein